jgi:hypothetical protein
MYEFLRIYESVFAKTKILIEASALWRAGVETQK